MATFLMLNGYDIAATADEQEQLILDLAAARLRREDLAVWLQDHTAKLGPDSAV
jgi:death-on-curing protein